MNPQELADQSQELLQGGNFNAAELFLRDGLPRDPDDKAFTDPLYNLAVALRYQDKLSDALDTIHQVQKLDPGFSRAWQEEGHIHRRLAQAADSRLAFQKAVRMNPALAASWRALEDLFRAAGMDEEEQIAKQQLSYLERLPRELVTVSSLLFENKLYKAETLCRHFLQNNRHHIEGMRLLAEIGNRLDVPGDPEFLLESCVEFAPEYDQARYDYANFLLKMQKFEPALAQIEILRERDPDNLDYKSMQAAATGGVGDHPGAIDLFQEVIEVSSEQNMLHVMLGHAQKTIGLFDAAVASYQEAYRIQPDYGDAFWSLANTKTYRFTEVEMEHMRSFVDATETPDDDRIHLCFALGKAHEDRQEYTKSFRYYSQGNDLKKESMRHKSLHLAIRTQAQKDVCTVDFFAEKSGLGHPAPDPIFIVGLPRAGSTLLEQVLASHSMVDGTFELPNIIALAQRLRGSRYLVDEEKNPRYPKILTEIEDSYFDRFGEQYIVSTRVYRQDAPFFVDKNPNNFFHIGLIKAILPNAKVIDARRHPMSCCFSGFKQLFGTGQEFSYGLEPIGNYYREYVSLMAHWDEVLPGQVLRVQHEDVIDGLENQVRRMLEFCGLPFEQACVDFHQTERSVRTPSSEQVRQPIQTAGLKHWQHFEEWLGPLKQALGPEVRGMYGIG